MAHSPLVRLAGLIDSLIEFKLYQPTRSDEQTDKIPFREGEILDYTTQVHNAKRAGRHRDIRIGNQRHGLLSWATRKELPKEGEKIAIHPTSVHPHSYLGWSGTIAKGYGAGDVQTERVGKALVTKATPSELHVTASNRSAKRLAFVRSPKGWLLARGKSPEVSPEAQKPKSLSLHPKEARKFLWSISKGTSVQPKIDGALTYVSVNNRPEIVSHRQSRISGRHIVHTERVFHGRPTLQIPRKFHGNTLIAETYGTRKGKAIPPQNLSGILNASPAESISRQKVHGIKLKVMPFDLAGEKASYPERIAKVREIVKHLPRDTFHVPEEAKTPGAAQRLFQKIRSGRHPLTKEGVIVHPPTGKITKIKNVEEENVKIHSLFKGRGRLANSHGGFYYTDEHGNPLGRVGTGFSDQTRRDLPKYVGRTARVRHQGRFESGRLRAPSFIAIDDSR